MKTCVGLALLLLPGICFADARFSIVRDASHGGSEGTESIALVCAKDAPALLDCKIFRAIDGVAQKSKAVEPATAQRILAAGAQKLTAYATHEDAPGDHLRWTLVYGGKTSQGGMELKDKKAKHALAGSLLVLENQLNDELER